MCNCIEQSNLSKSYDNVKKLAKLYSKHENKTVFIYETIGGFNFIDYQASEAKQFSPIEYISEL